MSRSNPLFGTRFGLYLCSADPKAQRIGINTVGYDLQNQSDLLLPDHINPEWIGGCDLGSFYLPLLEGIYTDRSFLPQIKDEIESCIRYISPQARLQGTKGKIKSKNGWRWWDWRIDPYKMLIILQTLLSIKLTRYITKSLI